MKTSTGPVHIPRDLAHALELRAAHPEAMPLAGCTDVMVFIEAGAIDPPEFLDLWGLDELRGIDATDGGLSIGALVTYSELIESAEVNALAPILVEASRTCGAKQIQNRGTLGGNIANASPAGDTLPVLLALDAEVELVSTQGSRRVRLDALYTGYRQLALEPDELITRVHLPAPHAADKTHYRKVGTRLAQAISKVVLGARVRIEDGLVTDARIAFGSVAATPIRCATVESALLGKPVDPAAADRVLDDIAPIDDIRSTADYRRSVSRRILRTWLGSLTPEPGR